MTLKVYDAAGRLKTGPGHQVVTATVTAAVATAAVRLTNPCSIWALQAKGTGAALGAWAVALEGSLDGTNFTSLGLSHTSPGDADGAMKWLTAPAPALYVRFNPTIITLGGATNLVLTALGMP